MSPRPPIALLLGLVLLPSLHAQQAPRCADVPPFAELDFWVGEWTVWIGDERVGTNRIAKQLDGCAITEEWHDGGGGEGRSLFFVPPDADHWQQVWLTSRALEPGGTKEKTQVREGVPAGSVRFAGTMHNRGRSWLDRTTLTPQPDGTVRQVIEVSTDGGASWRATFDAIYRRR